MSSFVVFLVVSVVVVVSPIVATEDNASSPLRHCLAQRVPKGLLKKCRKLYSQDLEFIEKTSSEDNLRPFCCALNQWRHCVRKYVQIHCQKADNRSTQAIDAFVPPFAANDTQWQDCGHQECDKSVRNWLFVAFCALFVVCLSLIVVLYVRRRHHSKAVPNRKERNGVKPEEVVKCLPKSRSFFL